MSKLHMYETHYDKLQPFCGKEKIQLHYKDCDSFVLSLKTENVIKGLKKLENKFDSSNLNVNHEIFGNKNKKAIGKFKIETSKNIWIDDFIALK